jgi:hypothetical protein
MPLDAIKITVQSIDIPTSWISAEEAKEIATSISNQNFVNFMNRIMEVIKVAAEEGRTSCGVSKRYENSEIVQRTMELLRTLGYEVANAPTSLNINW